MRGLFGKLLRGGRERDRPYTWQPGKYGVHSGTPNGIPSDDTSSPSQPSPKIHILHQSYKRLVSTLASPLVSK